MEASAKCEQWECHATGTEENYEVGSVPQQKVASHFGGWHSWESKKSAVSSFAEQIDYVSHLCSRHRASTLRRAWRRESFHSIVSISSSRLRSKRLNNCSWFFQLSKPLTGITFEIEYAIGAANCREISDRVDLIAWQLQPFGITEITLSPAFLSGGKDFGPLLQVKDGGSV